MREQVRRRMDLTTAAEALSTPGIDPRDWVKYGVVVTDPDPLHNPIQVEAGGVFIDVLLEPGGKEVTCRYAGIYAAPLGTVYFPIRQGDEVVVFITSGDEREGPVAMPRLHNDIDLFPLLVNGQVVDGTFPFIRIESGDWEIEVAGEVRMQAAGSVETVPPQLPGTAFAVARETDPVETTPTGATNPTWLALYTALSALVGFAAGPITADQALKLNAVGAAALAVLGVPVKGAITGGSTKMRIGG